MRKLFLLIFILLCTSCGRGGEEDGDINTAPSPAPSLDAEETWEWTPPPVNESREPPEKLTATLMYYGGETESDPLSETVLERFGLAIKLIPYPDSYENLLAVLASEQAPDMFMMVLSPARLAQLSSLGYIRDIPVEITVNNPVAEANRAIYGKTLYIPCDYDRNPAYAADSARFFYRKDWAETLHLPVPTNPGELYAMAKAYNGQQNPNSTEPMPLNGLVVDSPARLAALFGIDLWGWTEDGVPAYYSGEMLAVLNYARRLYDEGVLTFALSAGGTPVSDQDSDQVNMLNGGAAGLNNAGILVTKAGGAAALQALLAPVAESLGVTPEEALANHVGMMAVPYEAEAVRVWPNHYRPEGWLAGAGASDAVLERLLSFLGYTLSDEARDFSRYGILDVTYAENENGKFMFTDPETYAAYDLNALYPTGGFLNLLTQDFSKDADANFPSEVPYAIRDFFHKGVASYYTPMGGADALYRSVDSLLRDTFAIDFETDIYEIMTGTEPVDVMFDAFKAECAALGIEGMIEEVRGLAQ